MARQKWRAFLAATPLIRSRNNNLNVGLAYEAKKFQDTVDLTSSVTDKKAQVLMACLYGDHRDTLGGEGITTYSLIWSAGNINIQTPVAVAADAATARSNGRFNKLGFSGSRPQNLGGPFSMLWESTGRLQLRTWVSPKRCNLAV